MLTAYLTHPSFTRHEMGPGHPECPERLDAIRDHLVAQGLFDYLQPHEAPAATPAQLQRAHSAAYVAELRALAPREGHVRLDPDTLLNPHSLTAALHAAGAAVQAVDLVLRGEAANAFCAVRPPGHHAGRERGAGFCLFNNAAIAVRHALDVHGLQRVALCDFDVHHGDGSEDILAGDARVLLCSSYQADTYPYRSDAAPAANVQLTPLAARSGGAAAREAIAAQWLPRLAAFAPQLVVISAGFDAHRDDELGRLGWTEADYRWISEQLAAQARASAQGRIVSLLEGGYHLPALARSVAAHVRVLMET